MKEIERKFLIMQVPKDLEKFPHQELLQGYLDISQDDVEVRLRNKGDQYYQTIKIGTGQVRDEYEIRLSKIQFDALWPATEPRQIQKVRYYVPYEDYSLEVDVYKGQLLGLTTAEVEFSSLDESKKFELPNWFGTEVTKDVRYKNKHLAVHGIGKILNNNEKDHVTNSKNV